MFKTLLVVVFCCYVAAQDSTPLTLDDSNEEPNNDIDAVPPPGSLEEIITVVSDEIVDAPTELIDNVSINDEVKTSAGENSVIDEKSVEDAIAKLLALTTAELTSVEINPPEVKEEVVPHNIAEIIDEKIENIIIASDEKQEDLQEPIAEVSADREEGISPVPTVISEIIEVVEIPSEVREIVEVPSGVREVVEIPIKTTSCTIQINYLSEQVRIWEDHQRFFNQEHTLCYKALLDLHGAVDLLSNVSQLSPPVDEQEERNCVKKIKKIRRKLLGITQYNSNTTEELEGKVETSHCVNKLKKLRYRVRRWIVTEHIKQRNPSS